MIELAFFIAMFGSIIAGLWDLKTTEIPDEIPTLMACFGVTLWLIKGLTDGNFFPFLLSLIVGSAYLAFGWALYKTGQWGGGDAKLLSSIGYLLPAFPGVFLFSLSFFINVFVVGAVWTIIYALVIGLQNKVVVKEFKKDIKKHWKKLLLLPMFILMLGVFIIYYLDLHYSISSFSLPIFTFIILLLLSIFWRFGKIVEEFAFRKVIPVSKLKPGDVLADSKIWEGLTEEEIKRLKRIKKKVKIKEGVRFGPVFPIALFLTVFYGNILIPVM